MNVGHLGRSGRIRIDRRYTHICIKRRREKGLSIDGHYRGRGGIGIMSWKTFKNNDRSWTRCISGEPPLFATLRSVIR